MIMGHTNYENSDFRQNSAKKNGRRAAILNAMEPKTIQFNSSLVYA